MTFLDRLLGRPERKAATGGPWLTALNSGPLLSVLGASAQERAAQYLKAYKVGWFYKAGRKISGDIAGLELTLAYEDSEGDNADEIVSPAASVPFERLDPLEQFLRLMEHPNPYQSGRQLRQKTEIRIDFAGSAFWYLEGGTGQGLPTAIYGISPTRMFPSVDGKGNLLGWVMDANGRGGGTPFEVDEILPFLTETAGDEMWSGQGVVEAVYSQVPLTELMARHTGDVLTTGGRLAGMISPKNRTLDEAEYQDVLKAWRNVASDPNAARRLLVFPEPMEWSSSAASPKDIGLPELANLTRDEILTAFPLSPYQLGVPMPGGLNSAETRREDRRDYWEGSIHPRVELLEETIQNGLVGRYEAAVGRPLDFDIEEPNLDTAPVLIEKVGALRGLINAGFDEKEAISAVGLDHIRWVGAPAPAVAPAPPAAGDGLSVTTRDSSSADQAVTQQEVVSAKARMAEQRSGVVDRAVIGGQAGLEQFFRQQRDRMIRNVTAVWPADKASRKAPVIEWWNPTEEDQALSIALTFVYREVAQGSMQIVADRLGRVLVKNQHLPIAEQILRAGGERITEINATTRSAITDLLAEGGKRGYSISQIVDGVPAEGFTGLRDLPLANGQGAWSELRAETIARTETATAYNQAALGGYKSLGVARVHIYDGDKDDICAPWDGWEGPISEAPDYIGHPNCTRDFAPIVGGVTKAIEEPDVTPEEVRALVREEMTPLLSALEAMVPILRPTKVVVQVPDQPAPVVNVSSRGVQDVRLVASTIPPRKRTVKRDNAGRITEVREE